MNSHPVRPSTRWVVPPPWLASEAGAPPASPKAKDAQKPRPRLDRCTGSVLVELLQRDLWLGHHRVAVRHFLMARACGMPMPVAMQERCEQLLQVCPREVREGIEQAVRSWAEMMPSRGAAPGA